jgi:acetyl esterase/lipase
MRFAFRRVLLLACLVPLAALGFPSGTGPKVQKGIVYSTVDKTELKLDLVQPVGDGPFPFVLWIHGGAYQSGDRQDNMGAMLALAKRGFAGASIEYRLAPKYKWPAQLEDARAALAFLRGKAKEYKVDPNRVGVAGASAGGHLALMLGLAPREGKPAGIRAVVNIYGPSDLGTLTPTAFGDAILRQVLGKDMNAILVDLLGTSDRQAKIMAEASPLTYVAKVNPPVLTLHGSADPICPLTQSKVLHEALKKAGVTEKLLVVEGAGHDETWPADKRDMVNRAMIAFLDKHLKRQAP